MNDLCADIGYKSINHYGEQLKAKMLSLSKQLPEYPVVMAMRG